MQTLFLAPLALALLAGSPAGHAAAPLEALPVEAAAPAGGAVRGRGNRPSADQGRLRLSEALT